MLTVDGVEMPKRALQDRITGQREVGGLVVRSRAFYELI